MTQRLRSLRDPHIPLLTSAIAVLVAGSAIAQDDRGDRGERRGPPQVALDACDSAQDGGACGFEGRRGESLSGTCESIHETLVCVPEGHRRRGERAPNR